MIKVDNLSFSYYNSSETLKEISFNIPKGKWISIIGHNGSGKSTLSKLLVGLLEPQKGTITIDDLEINENNLAEVRRKIGIVFQNPDNQFVGVTVKHDIAFGLENQQIPKNEMIERIHHYAKLVGMEEYLDKEPQQLSGGQKQRVAIAASLAMEQEVIIFDEATSMLDPEGVLEISELIYKLNKEHEKTIITITHDLDFASKSDYILVLNEGNLVLQGTPLEVFKEEKILIDARLKLPYSLRLYHDIKKSGHEINKKLVDALWAYNLKK
ncbi:Cobalt ABC superfamily ATP binding cassette transporter [Alteracholeplasma palmae J233]|uniref:Cobalt ABC superfamily ATP binding cassette transporter n=1 Tax=Alteracholeplasma palmae (strain ATCC 49389 / J233) TaxID=1318466 RepID=U4KLT9_ALTPJ|nr:energy-coupling factor transporter ATPase [Alteracholeplasma palmae]CCV64893.1 Cobalt ABC superfamily ATP binding cassette transporter [Alteracholeplasma palmae J233]